MTQFIEELRGYLLAHPSIAETPSKTTTSGKLHLSSFPNNTGRPIGIEFDRKTLQSILATQARHPGGPSRNPNN